MRGDGPRFGAGRFWGDLEGDLQPRPAQALGRGYEDESGDPFTDLNAEEYERQVLAYITEGFLEEGRRRTGGKLTDAELLSGTHGNACAVPQLRIARSDSGLPLSTASSVRDHRPLPLELGKFTNTLEKVSLRLNKDFAATWSAKEVLELAEAHLSQFDAINLVMALHRVAKCGDRHDVQIGDQKQEMLRKLSSKVIATIADPFARIEAKEVTKTCWAFAKLSLSHDSSMELLAQKVISRTHELDAHSLSNALWSFATVRLREEPLLEALAFSAYEQLRELKPQGLSNTAWAFAKLDYCRLPLMQALALRVSQCSGDFDPQGLANTAWAFATMSVRHDGLMATMAKEMLAGAARWTSQNMVNLVWAFARLRIKHPKLCSSISVEALQLMHTWKPQGLANLLWAFAKLEAQDTPLLQALVGEVTLNIQEFQPQNLVNVLWGAAKLAFLQQEFLWVLSSAICQEAPHFNPQHCSNALWSFAVLAFQSPAISMLAKRTASSSKDFQAQDLANVLWSCCKLSYEDPDLLEAMMEEVMQKATSFEPQNLSISAFSLAQMSISSRPVLRQLMDTAASRWSEFDGQGLANLAQAMAKTQVVHEPWSNGPKVQRLQCVWQEFWRDIVKTVEHNCGNLPISLIRFFLDQEKKRDILMKSAAEVMGRLEDPLVCIWWRKDSKVEVRFLRGGVAWIERPPHWIRKALEKKSIREEVQRSMQNHYRLEWKRIRTVNVQGDWDPASSLATKRAARTKDTEAEPAEAEAAEAEAEEPAGVDEAVEERDREEEVDNAGATGEAFNEMSMGPSTEVEQNQLTPEEKEEILAKKTKKATMHTIWKSWNDEVQEAKREVSSEEQEHINARESMFGEMNLTAIQRIRYRASILPIRRRYAEEQERLQQLKKRLNDHDVGNIEEGLTDEQKKELINKALTGVGKLIKNSEDFLKLEVNKDVLGSNADPRKDKTTTAERRAVSFWLGRKKIFGLAYHERPTFEYKGNMHQSCLPTLLRRLGLEEYLYPAWVMEQLQRRLSMARSSLASSGPEALDYRGAPILWGRRRVWDSRARNHNLETREKAVLLLSQIEEALTAAQSIHSEDPGAKDVDPEQPDEEDEEATSEIGERAEATNQPEDVEDISPEEKDVEPALRRDTQKEADHEETAKAAEASMKVEAPTSPGGNAFGVAPVHAGADRAEEEEIDEADQAPSDTEVLEQTRQMEQNGELEKPGVVKEALEVETEDLAEGAEEIKQEVKVPVATPSTAASSTAAPTSPENHGLPPFEVLVEDTRSILKQILEMSDEQKEAHLACCGVPPFGPFLKKDMSEDELNEYSLFMAHSLMATKEAILRGAPRLSDIIEKINPLMLAEMHANFMAAKISKNEGSEGPRSPEMPGATEGFMTQFKEATGMVPSSAASSNAAPAIAENGGIPQFQVYLEGVMAEHEQMAALSEEERKAICEREGLPDFHGQWMAMDERERSKTMHAVAMRAMSQDMIFQEAQHQGIPWETLENSQTSPELAKKLLDDYMRRNQGSGGARSPEMSGAAEKLMAKGFKTHLKATEATHAGPKSQKTKMSQATERMMGKALIDSLKASTSTPEPVRPEVAVSLPDLHASVEEKQKAKAAKHAERRQKKLKVNEAVQKEDPGKEHAEWCEREKALRTDAFKLCDQLGKLLTQIAPRLDVAGQLKEKFDDALSMWFEHCDAVIDERRGTWTRKRRGHFEELEDAAEELEWWKFNSKSDHFMSLLKRGSTIIEKGAWAVHFAVEMLRSQSGALDEQLNPIVFEMTEEEDNAEEEEPEEPEGDMISSRAILKAMMTCFEHVEKAAELWKVGEKVEEEEVEEDGAASPSDRTALPAQAGLPDKDQEEDRPPPPATAEVDPHSQANGDKDGPPTPAQPEAASSSSKDPKEPRMKVCPACQEKVEQSRLKKHKSKECIMRVEECTVCQSRMSWKLLEEHKYECEGREVECPDCNNILIARQLPLHLETECPLRQVSCPNEAMGCDWRGPHEGLESHRLHCLADHQRRREEQQVAGVKAAPSQRELPPQHPAQGGYVDTFCAPEAPQPQATSSKSGVWPDDQEEEAREFARKHDLEWEMVRARFNSLNPPQREMIMRRFECPASHEPSGKFKNFVESCQKNGWWHCPSEAAWYQERALRRGTAVTAASSSMSQSSASPSRGAKAAPANFFVHDAIAKTKQEGEPLMKAPPATQEQFGIFKASSQAAAEAGAWSNYTPATTSQPQQTPDRVQEVMRKAPPMATQEDPWLNPEPKPAPPQPPMKSQVRMLTWQCCV
ncbi:unnamed protein product [Durusdinium trenchii]|uniref:TRAF-type domain-containing protein n=1 Tax=Durusdinium trenchii TaxID=1381693 RepID=A0ABP0JQL6_9DINO